MMKVLMTISSARSSRVTIEKNAINQMINYSPDSMPVYVPRNWKGKGQFRLTYSVVTVIPSVLLPYLGISCLAIRANL